MDVSLVNIKAPVIIPMLKDKMTFRVTMANSKANIGGITE